MSRVIFHMQRSKIVKMVNLGKEIEKEKNLRENPSICPTSSGKSKKFFFSDFAHGRKFCNVLNTIYQGTVYL